MKTYVHLWQQLAEFFLECKKFHAKVVEHTFWVQQMFSPENQTAYEIVWKNMAQPDMPQITTLYVNWQRIQTPTLNT